MDVQRHARGTVFRRMRGLCLNSTVYYLRFFYYFFFSFFLFLFLFRDSRLAPRAKRDIELVGDKFLISLNSRIRGEVRRSDSREREREKGAQKKPKKTIAINKFVNTRCTNNVRSISSLASLATDFHTFSYPSHTPPFRKLYPDEDDVRDNVRIKKKKPVTEQ